MPVKTDDPLLKTAAEKMGFCDVGVPGKGAVTSEAGICGVGRGNQGLSGGAHVQ